MFNICCFMCTDILTTPNGSEMKKVNTQAADEDLEGPAGSCLRNMVWEDDGCRSSPQRSKSTLTSPVLPKFLLRKQPLNLLMGPVENSVGPRLGLQGTWMWHWTTICASLPTSQGQPAPAASSSTQSGGYVCSSPRTQLRFWSRLLWSDALNYSNSPF